MSEMKMVSCLIPQPPAPDGFEHTELCRPPRTGEWLLSADGNPIQADHDWRDRIDYYRWILRPIPPAPTPSEVFKREYGRPFEGYPMPAGYGAAMENGEPKMLTEVCEGDIYLTHAGEARESRGAFAIGRWSDGVQCCLLLLRKLPAEPKEPTLTEMVTEHEKNLRSTGADYDEHGAICKILRKIAFELEAIRAR